MRLSRRGCAQPLRSLCTAAICQAEILAGIAVTPDGRRRADLEKMAQAMFSEDFGGRILPFDQAAAAAYANLFAFRRAKGRPVATTDLIIAATAQANAAAVVTRDIGGFDDCGLILINPWDAFVP